MSALGRGLGGGTGGGDLPRPPFQALPCPRGSLAGRVKSRGSSGLHCSDGWASIHLEVAFLRLELDPLNVLCWALNLP